MKSILEDSVISIAQKKLGQGGENGLILGPRLGTGGPFNGVFLWDTAFTTLWAKHLRDVLPVERSLDNLYRLQNAEGFISREFSVDGKACWPSSHPMSFAPPVLSWAELDLYGLTKDIERIKRVFPALCRHHEFCVAHFGRNDGLFIGDPWGSGMDNLPRWPYGFTSSDDALILRDEDIPPPALGWIRDYVRTSPGSSWNVQGRYIDMSAQMAFDARSLSQMAALIGSLDDEKRFVAEYTATSAAINELCWDEKNSFYFDLGYGKQIPRFHIGAFWTLIAGIVPHDRLDGFVSHLSDPKKFARPVPVPSLAADDPDYVESGDYWRGANWPPTTYMVCRGLRAVGKEDLAVSIAQKYYNAQCIVFDKTQTFWENLSSETPKPGNPAAPDFCGWAGLGPVAIAREFL